MTVTASDIPGIQMHVQIVPLSWQFGELRTIWRKSTAKGSLIPWSLASIYFRKREAAAV